MEDFKSSILDLNRLHFSANSVTTYFLIFGKVLGISCVPCGRWINIHRALTDECVEVSKDTEENYINVIYHNNENDCRAGIEFHRLNSFDQNCKKALLHNLTSLLY